MSNYLFEATLGGVAFSSLADELLLLDIVENPVDMQQETMQLAYRAGSIRTQNRRSSLGVELKYMIRTQDVARRTEVRNLVSAWAKNGGTLTVNTRPDMKLQNVQMEAPPALGSSLNWTDVLTVSFVAYGLPYWQSSTTDKVQVQTAYHAPSGLYEYHGVFQPQGNADSVPLTAMFVNAGDAVLTSLVIAADDTFVELQGMSVQPGEMLALSLDENSVFDATHMQSAGMSASLLPNRTAESSDELRMKYDEYQPGKIEVYADAAVTGSITIRRLWV